MVGVSGSQAFCLTPDGSMVGLGCLPGDDYSMACAVSAGGSTVVGYSGSEAEEEAFRWTAGDGMVGLGFLREQDTTSLAYDISADGSLIVGRSTFGTDWTNSRAFVWDEVNGMWDLEPWLTDHLGLDLAGWTLTSATCISADGKVIVGSATHPSGLDGCWRAVIPEPCTLALLGTAAVGLLTCVWRRSRFHRAGASS